MTLHARAADLHQASGTKKGFKGKIKPPRLGGHSMGVLATRTPHRPNPIGLSLCRIERVDRNVIVLSGADLVAGTPVLDVKPYVPFCEAIVDSFAPPWVSVRSRVLAVCTCKDTWAMPQPDTDAGRRRYRAFASARRRHQQ